MKKAKQKLANGGTVVKNYLQNPQEVLAENAINIKKAQAAAMNDNLSNIIGGIGTGAMAWGAQNGGMDAITGAFKQAFAMGGITENADVRLDDGEIIETPDGEIAEVQGDPAQKDGVETSLPVGTQVFSDRVTKDGKTMAERKEIREKQLAKLRKLMDKRPGDNTLKKTMRRLEEVTAAEEAQDMQIQESLRAQETQAQEFWTGGIVDAVARFAQKYNTGNVPEDLGSVITDQATTDFNRDTQQVTDNSFVDGKAITSTPVPQQTGELTETLSGADETGQELLDANSPGNYLGIAGNLYGMFKQMQNTKNSRATDIAHKNEYEGFTDEAMNTLDQSSQMADDVHANNLMNINRNAMASKKAGRNSARGVNTMRAMDLAVDQNANKASGDAHAQFAQNLMRILGQKSGMQMQAGQIEAQGQVQANQFNEAQKDAYYSAMAQNIADIATGLQQTGKDLNDVETQNLVAKMLNQLSKYGIGFDNKGNNIIKE